jgi:bis(5'-nucleosyl)-tetraphosphatase (symmetrical)
MATYAIGDIHGCFETLQALLEAIRFSPRDDRVWLVGDLVNRGPRSADVVRWAAGLGDRAVTVLGNHDLHLLARAAGLARPKRRDTLEDVLDAPDAQDLLDWLRQRPLIHREGDDVMVHAGLFPAWTLERAEELAREVERELRDGHAMPLLESVDRKTDERWKEGLPTGERRRVALAGFAKLRLLREDGRMCAGYSGPPEQAPRHCIPWFAAGERRNRDARIVFGHWAALGLRTGDGFAGIDSGCAWGGELTALRLDDGAVFQEPAREEGIRKRSRG